LRGKSTFLNRPLNQLFSKGPWETWIFFLVLSLSNGLLAYARLPYQTKFWIFLVGIFVPVFLYVKARLKVGQSPQKGLSGLSGLKFSWPAWILLFGGGIFLRFFKLTNFQLWPAGDEGLQGYFAIELVKNWNWQFFYTSGQHPPLLIWLLKFFFKIFDSPFLNLWFLPAFFSSLTLLTGYWAARSFLPKATCFLFCLLLAFSFWPLCFGRYCVQGVLVPFLEMLCFYFLALFLKSPAGGRKKWFAAILGLSLGMGGLTYTSWSAVILAVFIVVLSHLAREKKKDFFSLGILCLFFLLAFSPWLWGAWREGFGGYARGLSLLSGFFSWGQQLSTTLSYVTCLFWGPIQAHVGYGPVWGGVLNPILGSCFLLGVVEFFQGRPFYFRGLALVIFGILLMPGLLSADHVEMFRIIQVLPLLLVVTALGLERLIAFVPLSKRGWLLGVFVLSFLSIDYFHLFKPRLEGPPFHYSLKSSLADENYQAYQTLNSEASRQGPGLILTEFLLLSHNHTLRVASYHFNAADNPRLSADKARWTGVIINYHYQAFMKKRFPESRWYGVAAGKSEDGGLVVGIIPITDQNRAVMKNWLEAHQYFNHLNVQAENMLNNRELYQKALAELPDGYSRLKGDPFLESCFGEWLAQYHYGNDFHQNVLVLERAIAKGYPGANLYYKLGNFLWQNQQLDRARKAYESATRSKPNLTTAEENLRYLKTMEKSKQSPDSFPAGERRL
jgi:4-amino-4-deoxy-L-arabinose transferase-like glycosyltransferase